MGSKRLKTTIFTQLHLFVDFRVSSKRPKFPPNVLELYWLIADPPISLIDSFIDWFKLLLVSFRLVLQLR